MKKSIAAYLLLVIFFSTANAQSTSDSIQHKGRDHRGHHSYDKKGEHRHGIRVFHRHHHGKSHDRSASYSRHDRSARGDRESKQKQIK